MRIGIDAHFVGVRHGGNEYVFEHAIKGLAATREDGEELHAFSLDLKARGILPEPAVTLERLNMKSVYLQRALEIPRLAKRLSLDILHVPFNFLPVGRCRKVVHIHDVAFLRLKEAFTFAERQRMTLMTAFCSRRADHILTISEFSRKEIIEAYRIPESKVTVTPLAVDTELLRPWSEEDKMAFLDRRGLDFPFFLFVGTLQPRKNVVTMLRAFKAVMAGGREGKDVRIVLVGRKGWLYEEVFSFIRENGMEGRVLHFDGINAKELPGFYNTALAFVFPSLFEGFGLPILEAMACGCPVLSSNVSSMPEVYGDAALPFAPMDADGLADRMRAVIRDPALRRDLTAKGFENGRRFSWDRTARIIRKAYKSL